MGKGKQISINLITQLVSFMLNLAISFFITPYVIEFIGKEVYGFVSLANNFTSYVSVFTIALNGILSRYVTIAYTRKDYESASKYFSSVLIANIFILLLILPVTIFFVLYLEKFINIPSGFENDIKILFMFVFISFLLNLPGSCFNVSTYATNRLDKSNVCNMWASIIRISIIFLLLIILTPHVWYIGLASLVSVLYTIFKNIKYKKELTPNIKVARKYFDLNSVKEILSVGIWNSINQLTQLLMTGLDLIIANLFISVMSMNLLSYAKMIPTQMLILISTVSGIFAPTMTMAYASNDIDSFVKETNFSIKLCGFLCSVPTIGLVVFGEDFFRLWLQALNDSEIHIISILSILTILPQVFSVYIYPLYSVNTITAKLRIPVIVSLIMGILNVILVFLLLQITDLEVYIVAGVSSVLALFRIILFVPVYASYSIGVPLFTFYKPLFRGILSSLLMILSFILIKVEFTIYNWISFIFVCLLAGVVGYIFSFIIVFDKKEKEKMISIILNKIIRR